MPRRIGAIVAALVTVRSSSDAPAKCALYPSCLAQPKDDIPSDGRCCPASTGKMLDCCAGGVAKEPNVTQYNATTATCVIDVMQAAQMIGRAGTSLNAAVKVCVTVEPSQQNQNMIARCAAPVGNVISSFSYAASFLAVSAKECAESLHIKDFLTDKLGMSKEWIDAEGQSAELQAACAGAVTTFTAGLGQIAEAGPAITQSCEWAKGMAGGGSSSATDAHEAAKNGTFIGDSKDEIKKQREAMCAFDVGQTTTFLANAGLAINKAAYDCSSYHLEQYGKQAKAMCAVDTSRIITSFGFVASLLSYAVTNCPYFQVNLDAACSGAIADMITGISSLAASGAAFRDTCQTIANATMAMMGA